MPEPPQITLTSFGYKTGIVPVSNLTFDVRFLKNPYWEEALRPFSGLDKNIQEYVLSQQAAIDFLDLLFPFLNTYIGQLRNSGENQIKIAFGCTGGHHRSVVMVEAVAQTLQENFPNAVISKLHRELSTGSSRGAKTSEEHL